VKLETEETLQLLTALNRHTTQKSLAQELGYSVGKVNYILKALIDKGLVKVENFVTSESKKNYRYLLTAQGIREKIAITEAFIARKKREYEMLQRELESDRSSLGEGR